MADRAEARISPARAFIDARGGVYAAPGRRHQPACSCSTARVMLGAGAGPSRCRARWLWQVFSSLLPARPPRGRQGDERAAALALNDAADHRVGDQLARRTALRAAAARSGGAERCARTRLAHAVACVASRLAQSPCSRSDCSRSSRANSWRDCRGLQPLAGRSGVEPHTAHIRCRDRAGVPRFSRRGAHCLPIANRSHVAHGYSERIRKPSDQIGNAHCATRA